VFVGFTSATDIQVNQHEILSWSFTSHTLDDPQDLDAPSCDFDLKRKHTRNLWYNYDYITYSEPAYISLGQIYDQQPLNSADSQIQNVRSGIQSIKLSDDQQNLQMSYKDNLRGAPLDFDIYLEIDDPTKASSGTVTVTDVAGNSCSIDIAYSGKPPEAVATVSLMDLEQSAEESVIVDSLTVKVGERIKLDGSDSTDPDGDELFYRWDLNADSDDDKTVNGVIVETSYEEVGTYIVTLSAYTDENRGATTTVTIKVEDIELQKTDVTPPLCELKKNDDGLTGLASDDYTENNGPLDYNSGLAEIKLVLDDNIILDIPLFNEGDLEVNYVITQADLTKNSTGQLVVTDVVGNRCIKNILINAPEPNSGSSSTEASANSEAENNSESNVESKEDAGSLTPFIMLLLFCTVAIRRSNKVMTN